MATTRRDYIAFSKELRAVGRLIDKGELTEPWDVLEEVLVRVADVFTKDNRNFIPEVMFDFVYERGVYAR